MTVPIAAPEISARAKEAVEDVLDSGMLAAGEQVRRFEEEFAAYVGTEHAVATSSGTTALQTMLEAAGIGSGDAVVTTPFSFIATANAIVHAGADPVFADIDPTTYNLDPDRTRELLGERDDVAAVMPVHLYGLPADMDAFAKLADKYDLQLFEDAAQAHGAAYRGTPAGALSDAAAFSFYPTKNMTTGEGGMITTDDADLAERARRLVDHGRAGRYEHVEVGYNFRMTDVQAAIGRDQLSRLDGWIEARRQNARALTRQLADREGVTPPASLDDRRHAYHQYTIRVRDRAAVSDALEVADIGYGVYYPTTIPAQPAYAREADNPVAERVSDSVLSLPVHPGVTTDAVESIADVVIAGGGGAR